MSRKKSEPVNADIHISEEYSENVVLTNVNDVPESSLSGFKTKRQEPYKPFLLIADLGRSSCKSLVYSEGREVQVDKLTSCVVQLDKLPANNHGGFTLGLERPHETEVDEKGKPIKVKTEGHWIVGARAQAYPNHKPMTSSANAKIDYFHILLMGVIATLPNLKDLSTGKSQKSQTLTIDLATLSIADSNVLKKELKHCKFIIVDGTKYRLNFTSNSHSFVEGHGAAIWGKNQYPERSTLYVADLGAGTFQIAEFSILNRLPSKKSKDSYHGGGGVTSLKREVTKALSNDDDSSYLNQSQVTTILEKSQWDDGQITASDYRKSDVSTNVAYAINQWLAESPAQFALEDLVTISRYSPIIFCGGGFEIQSVRGIIEKRILESGGESHNLVFPETLGLIGIRGVLDYLIPCEIPAIPDTTVIEPIKEIENADNQQTA